MKFHGYKIRLTCADWEQVDTLGKLWKAAATVVSQEKLVGVGMDWQNHSFSYAIGVLDEDVSLNGLKKALSDAGFEAAETNLDLPDSQAWQTFHGKLDDLRVIYERQIDCYEKPYDYELEIIDSDDNLTIMIHYIEEAQ